MVGLAVGDEVVLRLCIGYVDHLILHPPALADIGSTAAAIIRFSAPYIKAPCSS